MDYWRSGLGPDALRLEAAKFHGVLASSAGSERLFSVCGYIGRARRMRLAPLNLSALAWIAANMLLLEEYRKKIN